MDFIPGVDGPSEGVPRVLACFSNVCVLLSFFLAEDRYISFESMFSLLRRCMLPMVLQNLLRREPLKLVDGGQSQRTFVYIKDAIEAVVLMIVCYLPLSLAPCYSQINGTELLLSFFLPLFSILKGKSCSSQWSHLQCWES
jgi:hypothetical protein